MQVQFSGLTFLSQQLSATLRKTAIAAVAGTGLMLVATASHAVVVFSGPVSLVVPATTSGLYLNVVTGVSGIAPAAVPGWDVNPWSSTGLGFFNAATPVGGVYVMAAPGTAANLPLGAMINGASAYGSGSSANTSQWVLNSSNNYFGFRFTNEAGGTTHYGFAQLAIGATITARTIIGYAYESTPLLGISVSVVPEPATYGLMAAGVAGLLLVRRRKQA